MHPDTVVGFEQLVNRELVPPAVKRAPSDKQGLCVAHREFLEQLEHGGKAPDILFLVHGRVPEGTGEDVVLERLVHVAGHAAKIEGVECCEVCVKDTKVRGC